jgi:anti-sigma-K factor RskA
MSSAEHGSVGDLAAAYALGALSPEEAREFETFLASSPEAQREVAEYRDVAALLALSGPEAAPSADLRDRVLGGVRGQKARSVPRRTSPIFRGALAASLVAVAGLGSALISARRQLASVAGQLDSTSIRLDSTRQLVAVQESTLGNLLKPDVELFQLTASGDPDPRIQLFWDRARSRAVLNAIRLRQLDPGKAYQLWFIKDGKPVPSVTFKPGPTGDARIRVVEVPAGGDISAAAVTIEPDSGSQQPTMPIVMVGSLKKS